MNTVEKQSVIERYVYAYNAFDVEGMLSLLHPDIEFKTITEGKVVVSASGIEEFRILAEQGGKSYSSRKQTIMEYYEKKNKAIIEIAYSGVLAIDLPEGMKAGDTLNIKCLTEILFHEGKIYRLNDIM